MASVTYDDRSLMIDGQRIWLMSGSVHYFRTPSALWEDRLLKAKRAGLNCISTFIPWNYHEPAEGRWELTGEKDIGAFIRMAGELGLYVILRPGPYIGGQWDFGGLPGWLTTRQGVAYRTNNATFTHYYDKYLGQILPRLAELQVTRGGNIILIQNENRYYMTTMPDRLSYLTFITQLFRRSGFDIPVITCNDVSEPPVPDSIECATGCRDLVQKIKRLRYHQPGAPLFVAEFHTGQPDRWGGEHVSLSPRETARLALEALGCGAQVNYYPFHGGTNFGFWGGRMADSEASYQTTSYDYDAPLAEGGGLTEKYYLSRLFYLFATGMGRLLAPCIGGPPAVTIHNATQVFNLAGPEGRWAVATNNGRDDINTAQMSLPDGRELTVSLEPIGAAAVPIDLTLGPNLVLDYANVMPLGLFGDKTLVFHGPVGWSAELSVNGHVLRATIAAGDEPQIAEHEGLVIVLINSNLATRTWLVEETLVFGPRFVGPSLEEIVHAPKAKQIALLPLGGKLSHKKVPASHAAKAPAPRLSSWNRTSVCVEPVSQDLTWSKIDRAADVDKLGVPQGYVWYRLTWDEQRAHRRNLLLPGCEDRATVYLNGNVAGVWGRGDGASRKPIAANVQRGANTLTLLLDNLGRPSEGFRLGEAKGLFGHVYDVKPIQIRKPKLKKLEKFPRRIVPRGLLHLIGELEKLPLWSARVDLSLSQVTPIHLSFAGMPHHAAVLCNDHTVGFYPCEGANYADLTLTAGLKKGKNLLELMLWGDVQPDVLNRINYYSLIEPVSLTAAWGFRRWEMPSPGGPVVGKDQPAWYVAKFKYAGAAEPLFLHIAGARKGQVFLNGQNLGRFWTIGPQQFYYLPECFLRQDNEVLLFVEDGTLPRRTRLELRPWGPYRD